MTAFRIAFVSTVLILLCTPVLASEFTIQKPDSVDVEYSPYINKAFPQNVYWGDTHVHTTYSPDAGMVGNFNLGIRNS
jgi:hypothetical protein